MSCMLLPVTSLLHPHTPLGFPASDLKTHNTLWGRFTSALRHFCVTFRMLKVAQGACKSAPIGESLPSSYSVVRLNSDKFEALEVVLSGGGRCLTLAVRPSLTCSSG